MSIKLVGFIEKGYYRYWFLYPLKISICYLWSLFEVIMSKKNAGMVVILTSSLFVIVALSGCEGCSSGNKSDGESHYSGSGDPNRPNEPAPTPPPRPMGPTQEDLNRGAPPDHR